MTTIPWAPHDRRRSVRGTGLLRAANDAGLLEAADVQVADRLTTLGGEVDERVALAVALLVRALRAGSVCLDLRDIRATEADGPAADLDWPDPDAWVAAVASSPLVVSHALHIDDGLVHLDRYWREEQLVADTLRERVSRPAPQVDEPSLEAGAHRIFADDGWAEQRDASLAAARRWTTLVTGGPGTGKTTAVAGLIALLAEQEARTGGRALRIALTAPTGKAAARLHEAVTDAALRLPGVDRDRVGELSAQTLHRLLGFRPGYRTRFRHDRANRLPHDLVVVDETSMVSLTMMARLLEAIRPDARLVLVGDPDQLSSVEAGAVLSDLVAGYADVDPGAVASLRTSHRFGAGIGDLAGAVRDGDADLAVELLRGGRDDVLWLPADDSASLAELRRVCLRHARSVQAAAEAGDAVAALAALDAHRLLTAHREGPFGAAHWNRQVERWLTEVGPVPVGAAWGRPWYAGRPLLVTANDYSLGLFNGDTGVTLAEPGDQADGHAPLRAVIDGPGGPARFATSRLADVETMHAMTIHKSQGSQAQEVGIVLPAEDSTLLTRELLYTAVTRAQRRVRLVGSEAALRAAVTRRAQRASGLRRSLGRSAG